MVPQTTSIAEYYRAPAVRERIREFCGDGAGRPLTCVALAAVGPSSTNSNWDVARDHPADSLDLLLDTGCDVARSLWDSESLLFYLDVDYQNVDYMGDAFIHPADAFLKLEPVYRAARHIFRLLGLPVRAVMTGRGYHFLARVPIDAGIVDRLAEGAAEDPRWFATYGERRIAWMPELDNRRARAHATLGAVTEYLAHLITRRSARRCRIPVVSNGTVVGSGVAGRECVSIDFSHAGDPLDIRHARVAFGAYQNHVFRPDVVGTRVATIVPALVTLPRDEQPLLSMLARGRGTRRGMELAMRRRGSIPEAGEGISRLYGSYLKSRLASFHRDFYTTIPDSRDIWPRTYDRFDLSTVPPCTAVSLRQPNDLLLQPAYLQHVTRDLMSRGWHPRHIAGLVHSRYVRDHGWGGRWRRIDAQTRAEFDVRVFAGMIATGLDRGVDFNCRSTQEKGLCPGGGCRFDLRRDRERLFRMVHS